MTKATLHRNHFAVIHALKHTGKYLLNEWYRYLVISELQLFLSGLARTLTRTGEKIPSRLIWSARSCTNHLVPLTHLALGCLFLTPGSPDPKSTQLLLRADSRDLPVTGRGQPTFTCTWISVLLVRQQLPGSEGPRLFQLNPGAKTETRGGCDTSCVMSLNMSWDFAGGPMAKTLHSQCREPRFNPWSGN